MPFRQTFGQIFGLYTTIAGVVFGLVAAALLTAIVASWYRRRRGKPASRKSKANRLELGVVTALAGMAAFLVVASFSANAKESPAQDPAMRVQVTAFQWCWQFRYTGQPVTVTARCQGGPLPTLVLPTGRPVELDVTATDVIHAVWVPYLKYKLYAYPDHVNRFTVTLHRDGRWIGRCAQICGLYHFQMDFYLKAVPPAQFSHWLRDHRGTVTTGSGA